MFLQMKQEGSVITTNGMDVANPVILAKFAKGRVNGTLVYPNALAGIILLLFPISIVLAFNSHKKIEAANPFRSQLRWSFFSAARDFFGRDQNSAGSSRLQSAAFVYSA